MDEKEKEIAVQAAASATSEQPVTYRCYYPPRPAPKPPFTASRRDVLAALLLYVGGYLYVCYLTQFSQESSLGVKAALAGFLAIFVGVAELIHRSVPRSGESWVWLGCMALIALSLLLRDGGRVWGGDAVTFLHIFSVWWVLSRSGKLCEGQSGHLLPLDGFNGLFRFPFQHFFLRLRTLWYALTHLHRGKKLRSETVAWAALALGAAVVLFAVAVHLLMQADSGFDDLLRRIAAGICVELHLDWEVLGRFWLSLPIGAYLFGLLGGTARESRESVEKQGQSLLTGLAKLRRVPQRVWTVLAAAFALLYLVFFIVQGRYLFGAFTRTLPEGFVVSQYARQGFFELCKVMAVNFTLLWLITRLSVRPVREDRPTLILCGVILAESMLLAVVAFSKLALYIDIFGFTPLRLQSSWLVCLLFAGCLCAGRTLLTGKSTFRAWMIFGAVTLSTLCLY